MNNEPTKCQVCGDELTNVCTECDPDWYDNWHLMIALGFAIGFGAALLIFNLPL